MEIIEKYKTFDDKEFYREKDALNHLDELIYQKLHPICHEIVSLKYKDIHKYVIDNLHVFNEIYYIKQDKNIIK